MEVKTGQRYIKSVTCCSSLEEWEHEYSVFFSLVKSRNPTDPFFVWEDDFWRFSLAELICRLAVAVSHPAAALTCPEQFKWIKLCRCFSHSDDKMTKTCIYNNTLSANV